MSLFDSLRNVFEGAAGDQFGGLADTAQSVLSGDLGGIAEQATGHDIAGLATEAPQDPVGTAFDLIGGGAP